MGSSSSVPQAPIARLDEAWSWDQSFAAAHTQAHTQAQAQTQTGKNSSGTGSGSNSSGRGSGRGREGQANKTDTLLPYTTHKTKIISTPKAPHPYTYTGSIARVPLLYYNALKGAVPGTVRQRKIIKRCLSRRFEPGDVGYLIDYRW